MVYLRKVLRGLSPSRVEPFFNGFAEQVEGKNGQKKQQSGKNDEPGSFKMVAPLVEHRPPGDRTRWYADAQKGQYGYGLYSRL